MADDHSPTVVTPELPVRDLKAQAIQHGSTRRMLDDMRNSSAPPARADPSGHETRRRLQMIVTTAGWDSFTVLLRIAQWADRHGHTAALIGHFERLAADTGR